MKILLAHNYYQYPGGEDSVFQAESDLLANHGHQIVHYIARNSVISDRGLLRVGWNSIWSRQTHRDLTALLEREKPALAHFHNTFPLISPSAYYACSSFGIPVVHTVHNYRLVCPAATLYRENAICEDCLGRSVPWPGVLHACYQASRLRTFAVALMLSFNKAIGTWKKKVQRYIALTEFQRLKLIEGGLPAERIVIKPNFLLPDPELSRSEPHHMVFIGRLVREKGIMVVLDAWRLLPDVPLVILGDGPLRADVEHFCQEHALDNVRILGHRPHPEAMQWLDSAWYLLQPSEWYEGFPMTVLEALARGIPVISSNLAAFTPVLLEKGAGMQFEAGEPASLVQCVRQALSDPILRSEMSAKSRRLYLESFSAEASYQRLMQIYSEAQDSFRH